MENLKVHLPHPSLFSDEEIKGNDLLKATSLLVAEHMITDIEGHESLNTCQCFFNTDRPSGLPAATRSERVKGRDALPTWTYGVPKRKKFVSLTSIS